MRSGFLVEAICLRFTRSLKRKKDACEIHRDGALPSLLGCGAELKLRSNACVRNYNIGRPGLVEGALERCAVRDVNGKSADALWRARSRGVRALQIENCDACAAPRQNPSGGRADAIRAAGNHSNLAGEIEAHLTVIHRGRRSGGRHAHATL